MNESIKALRGDELIAALDERLANYAVKNGDSLSRARMFEEALYSSLGD